MGIVRTVLRDIDTGSLGRVNYHEHSFQVSRLLPGDELTDEAAPTAEAIDVRHHGIDTVADATLIGLGRDPEALAPRRTVGAACRCDNWGSPGRALRRGPLDAQPQRVRALASWFIRDLTDGCAATDKTRFLACGIAVRHAW
jgi:predicted metal-dependent phosphotriesterase family hydrolase